MGTEDEKGMKREAIIRKIVTTTVRVARALKTSSLYRKINTIKYVFMFQSQTFCKNFMNANEILNRIMMLHQTPLLPSQIPRQLHLLLMSHNTDDVLALIALKSEQSEEKSWYKNI